MVFQSFKIKWLTSLNKEYLLQSSCMGYKRHKPVARTQVNILLTVLYLYYLYYFDMLVGILFI